MAAMLESSTYDPNQFIEVSVVNETRTMETASFDIPMFLAGMASWGSTVTKTYTSTKAMLADGIPSNHPAYLFASKAFSGTFRPNKVIVGNWQGTVGTELRVLSLPSDSETVFNIKVGYGDEVKTVTHTAVAGASTSDTAVAIAALINAAFPLGLDAAASSSYVQVDPADPATAEFAITTTDTHGLLTIETDTALDDPLDSLNAIVADNNDFFYVAADTYLDASQEVIAQWCEEAEKIYVMKGLATEIASDSDTDIASTLKAAAYANTHIIVPSAANMYTGIEGAIIGSIAAVAAGKTTLFAKTLKGIVYDSFSATEVGYIQDKNANFYARTAGAGFYVDGRNSDGTWFDAAVFALWAKIRTREAIFKLMKKKSDAGQKIPRSDVGNEMIRQAIFEYMINPAIRNGAIITKNEGAEIDPEVYVPDRSEATEDDLSNRILRDVNIEFIYSGAVQNVKVVVYIRV